MATAERRRVSVTTQGEREIVLSRFFNAPRPRVWDAWTKAELVSRWFGAKGWTMPTCEIDLRVGGGYRYVMRDADGREIVMKGEYREIAAPERLVSTEYFEGFTEVGWRPEDATVGTMVLTDRDGGTQYTSTLLYPSKQVRDDAFALKPAWSGLEESFDRMEEALRP